MPRRFARIGSISRFPDDLRGAVVAIGNFDGLHRGHRAVLDRARAEAEARACAQLVLTFEPHPRTFFRPATPVFRLTPAPVKAMLLERLGLDGVVELSFDRALADMSAEDFVRKILVDGLGVSHAVTGFNFHFGRERQGGPAFLMDAGARYGFGVTLVDAFRDEGVEVVSSSRIRKLLAGGEPAEAAGLLGYRYMVEGVVARGRQLGRTLGYPTANMALHPDIRLRHGIYAVRLRRPGGPVHDGVASFGLRPTVEADGAPLLETYLFDFDRDIYGEACTVSLFGFLRPELKFDGLEALVVQMKRDEAEARALLAGVRPLSELDAELSF